MILRVILIATCFYVGFSLTRVTASLDALAHGAGSLEVGLLIGLLSLFPTFMAIACGRWIDRTDPRTPFVIGGVTVLFGIAIPFAFPAAGHGLLPLALSCSFVGIGIMVITMLVQRLVGALSTGATRLANFSWLATATAASGFFSPVASGYIIDHASHQLAFGFGTLVVAGGVAFALLSLRKLPATWGDRPAGKKQGKTFELLRVPRVRNVLLVSALVSMAWDLQVFMFPVYGNAIGLSATEIGWLIGAFCSATFAVRFLMPVLAKFFTEWQFLIAVLAVGAASYALLPFFTDFAPLAACAFILGLGLGASQPNVMSLLQTQSPKGRVGEALGIRTTFTNLCHMALPAGFGVLAAAFGVFWIFIAMAAILGISAVLVCFRNREGEAEDEGMAQ